MKWIMLSVALLAGLSARATNYDEAKAGTYTLPDPLVCEDGTRVTNADAWFNHRRPEILQAYREHVFGHDPDESQIHPGTNVTFNVWDLATNALDGTAIRKQIELNLSGTPTGPLVHFLLYLPAHAQKPAPVFLCLQFNGNYTVDPDSGIAIFPVWNNRTHTLAMPKDPVRGAASHNWEITKTLARGYGIAFIDYQEIEPDFSQAAGNQFGIRNHFPNIGPDSWGAIGAWSWGASRVLDYLITDPQVDAHRVILFGHSRLGKTVLWAGAQDTRFAAIISNCSGEMGASLSRRDYGETIDDVVKHFPYWMCPNFQMYAGHWNDLPVDAHSLLSLIAPRPLFINSGSEDTWADPRGQFLAARAATPVYNLLGRTGITETEFPELDQPIEHDLAFNCHKGKHDVLPSDWDKFLDFADHHFPH